MRFVFFLCIMVPVMAMAQNQPDPYRLIEYHSDFERKVFQSMRSGDTNHIQLLMAASGSSDSALSEKATQSLESIIDDLDSAKLRRKRPKKQIKKIFESVHDRLLKKYRYENQFCEIFEDGDFNCLSATAVYSYMLTRLGIENLLIESPSHVYVIAYIEDEQWVMESTDPSNQGYFELTDKAREKQLDQLVEQKIITVEERNSPGLDSILQELYPNRAITATELVSYQYTNQALYDLEVLNYESAVQNALKACAIHRGEHQKITLNQMITSWLGAHGSDHPEYPAMFTLWVGSDTSSSHQNIVLGRFGHLTDLLGNEDISLKSFDSIYSFINAVGFANDSLARHFKIAYNDGMARYYRNLQRSSLMYKHARHLIRLDTASLRSCNIFMAAIGLLFYEVEYNALAFRDTALVYEELAPRLMELPYWNKLHAALCLDGIIEELNSGHYAAAQELRVTFEQMIESRETDIKIDEAAVSSVYTRLAVETFDRSKQRALQIINKGLELAPGNERLSIAKSRMSH